MGHGSNCEEKRWRNNHCRKEGEKVIGEERREVTRRGEDREKVTGEEESLVWKGERVTEVSVE